MRGEERQRALEEAWTAVDDVADRLGLAGLRPGRDRRDPADALAALEAAAGALRDLGPDLGPGPGRRPGPVTVRQSTDGLLLLRVRAARAELLSLELSRQRSLTPLLSAAVARLRTATTITDLIESIPIATARLGYERVMFSWVDEEHWVPRSMYTLSGPQEAQAILDAGAPPYVHVRDLLEIDVVRRRKAILVLDADTNPRVHPKITPVSRSRTFVAAPVVARNHVAALVHLDRNAETGLNDEFDRDLLALLCESIGALLDQFLTSDTAVAQALPDEPVLRNWSSVLTTREEEVLRLAATGLTNAEIGERLFISAETAKSHLKKLMRKLGAHTRGEASALYLQLRTGGPLSERVAAQLAGDEPGVGGREDFSPVVRLGGRRA